jgi:hypothetical protein
MGCIISSSDNKINIEQIPKELNKDENKNFLEQIPRELNKDEKLLWKIQVINKIFELKADKKKKYKKIIYENRNDIYVCPTCNQNFNNINFYKLHCTFYHIPHEIQETNNELPINCFYCYSKFSDIDKYTEHIENCYIQPKSTKILYNDFYYSHQKKFKKCILISDIIKIENDIKCK